MNNIVEVRPIERIKWHGKKGKEAFSQPVKFGALVSTVTETYATGLSDSDIEFLRSKGIKERLDNFYDPNNPHPFWDESKMAKVILSNRTELFNIEKVSDFIKVKIMKASDQVANSLEDYQEGKAPYATHYIFSEVQKLENKASQVELKYQAIDLVKNLPKSRKLEILLLLNGKDLSEMTDNYLVGAMDTEIEKNASEIIRLAQKDKEVISMEATITRGVLKNVLSKVKGVYYYGETRLGNSLEEAVSFLMNPDYQELRVRIINNLEIG